MSPEVKILFSAENTLDSEYLPVKQGPSKANLELCSSLCAGFYSTKAFHVFFFRLRYILLYLTYLFTDLSKDLKGMDKVKMLRFKFNEKLMSQNSLLSSLTVIRNQDIKVNTFGSNVQYICSRT